MPDGRRGCRYLRPARRRRGSGPAGKPAHGRQSAPGTRRRARVAGDRTRGARWRDRGRRRRGCANTASGNPRAWSQACQRPPCSDHRCCSRTPRHTPQTPRVATRAEEGRAMRFAAVVVVGGLTVSCGSCRRAGRAIRWRRGRACRAGDDEVDGGTAGAARVAVPELDAASVGEDADRWGAAGWGPCRGAGQGHAALVPRPW